MSNKAVLLNGVGMAEVSPPVTDPCTRNCFVPVLSVIYSREPSVRRLVLVTPSWVIWLVLSTLGGGRGRLSQANIPPRTTTSAAVGTRIFQSFLPPGVQSSATFTAADDGGAKPGTDPDVDTPCCATDCAALSCTTATEPELGTPARPVSVSRFTRSKSARISAAP